MALSAKQRNALPPSAFLDRKNRRFPMPTKAQARHAGISEAQRMRTVRNAASRAAQPQARGVKKVSLRMVHAKARTRAPQMASARPASAAHRSTARPAHRASTRRVATVRQSSGRARR
jgi:hypothetical protein